MAEIVNLRLARKRKRREDEAQQAARNRQAHGVAKADKQAAHAGRQKQASHLDAHRLDRADEE